MENSHAHIVSLVYKLVSSAKYSNALSIASDRDLGGRRN